MADTYAYDDRDDGALDLDMIEKSSDSYLRQRHIKNKNAVLDKAVPTAAVFEIADEVVSDDLYNAGWLMLRDDDDAACVFAIDDTIANAGDGQFVVDLTTPVIPKGVDKTLKFTTASTFKVTIAGTQRFAGYTDDPSYEPDIGKTDVEVDVPRRKLRTRIDYVKGQVNLVLRSSPKTLLDAMANMVSIGGSPDKWFAKDMGASYPTFVLDIQNIKTIDSNEIRREIFPDVEFNEPAIALGAPVTGDVTYELNGMLNTCGALNTNRLNR